MRYAFFICKISFESLWLRIQIQTNYLDLALALAHRLDPFGFGLRFIWIHNSNTA